MGAPGAGGPLHLPPLDARPLVSVLITNYNYGRFVGEAIQSVLDQTYDPIEVVVCDDASTDDSRERIRAFAELDARVKTLELPENRGMAAGTNAAYAASSGRIVCLLDADDTYDASKVEAVVEVFRNEPRTGLLIHPLMIVEGGRPIQQIPFLTRFERGWIAERVVRRGGRWRDMGTSAMCFRREAAEFAFPIPEEPFRRAADGFLFTLLPLLTEVSAIDRPLGIYRKHGDNDHLVLGLDARVLRSETAFHEQQIGGVNERLAEIGRQDVSLDLDRHLAYRQKVLLLAMLDGAPRPELIRQYREFARLLLHDDLYSSLQKGFGVVSFGVGIVLPVRYRGPWFSATMGHNAARQRLKGLIGRLRGR